MIGQQKNVSSSETTGGKHDPSADGFRACRLAEHLAPGFPAALAQDVKLPPTMTFTAYDTGTAGFKSRSPSAR